MIGKRLQNVRKKLQLSQEDISTQIGISYRAYSSYEREDRKPSIDFLELLVTKFNINLNFLIAGVGEMFIKKEPAGFREEIKQAFRDMIASGELSKDDFK